MNIKLSTIPGLHFVLGILYLLGIALEQNGLLAPGWLHAHFSWLLAVWKGVLPWASALLPLGLAAAIPGYFLYLFIRDKKAQIDRNGPSATDRAKLQAATAANHQLDLHEARWIARADAALAKWSGKSLWSYDGAVRCMAIAMLYPVVLFSLGWLGWNSGQLMNARLLPNLPDALARWQGFGLWLILVMSLALGYRLLLRPTEIFGRLSGSSIARRLHLARGLSFLASWVNLHPRWARCVGLFLLLGFWLLDRAGAFAVAGAGAVAGAVAVAGAFALIFAYTIDKLEDRMSSAVAERAKARKRNGSLLIALAVMAVWFVPLAALVVFLIWLVPGFPEWGIPIYDNALDTKQLPFVLLYFFGALPVLNALSDWVSFNVTRALLQKYQRDAVAGKAKIWQIYVLDVVCALLLTFLVFAGAIGILKLMHFWGWLDINLAVLLKSVQIDPFASQSVWLLTLALTNFVPTIIHVVMWAMGWMWSRDKEAAINIDAKLNSDAKLSSENVATVGWGPELANQVVSVLIYRPLFERIVAVGLFFALLALIALSLPLFAKLALPLV